MTATFWDDSRTTLDEAVSQTVASLREYGSRYQHWALAYSGGKDSTALVTVVCHLIRSGAVGRPTTLTVLYADTRMELPPLQISAEAVMRCVRIQGYQARMVMPPLDDRFMVYVLGRGVPPPSNTFRWCTGQIKVEPMVAALAGLREAVGGKLLMLTGVRVGESAARDARIALSCSSKNGGECGQGWFQEATPEAVADTLAPLLHWRVCHVWDWIRHRAPSAGFPTAAVIADVYGGKNDAEGSLDLSARTGCVGCNLASRDDALDRTLSLPQWSYLAPLKRLRPLYAGWKRPGNRLRKPGGETRANGSLGANQGRLGPLTHAARLQGLADVLAIQADINVAARASGRPEYSLINAEEEARIRGLNAVGTWPNGWDGTEPVGDSLPFEVRRDGSVQSFLWIDSDDLIDKVEHG
jgi:DNA sulfur modification protein DndC